MPKARTDPVEQPVTIHHEWSVVWGCYEWTWNEISTLCLRTVTNHKAGLFLPAFIHLPWSGSMRDQSRCSSQAHTLPQDQRKKSVLIESYRPNVRWTKHTLHSPFTHRSCLRGLADINVASGLLNARYYIDRESQRSLEIWRRNSTHTVHRWHRLFHTAERHAKYKVSNTNFRIVTVSSLHTAV